MELTIKKQEKFSRLQLILRTLFGWIYIVIPHCVALIIFGIWSFILTFLAFWAILFTGKYPKSWFDYQVKMFGWNARLNASLFNLIDGYPQIGVGGSNPLITLNIPYPASLSRLTLILRIIFGFFYILIPHGFCLYFRMLWGYVIMFLAWFVVLFTGKFPDSFFNYQVGSIRWSIRLSMYMVFLTDTYPPFSGK